MLFFSGYARWRAGKVYDEGLRDARDGRHSHDERQEEAVTIPKDPFQQAVAAQAALLDIEIDDAHLAATVENLRRIGSLAKLVMEWPLPPEAEPAPVFSRKARRDE